jgi:hypothetical protein
MPHRSFVPHWLLWSLPAVVAAQVVLMLVSSGPDRAWRNGGYTMIALGCVGVSACAGVWALWRLRDWPVALRAFIALVQLPLVIGGVLLAGA